VSPYALDLPRRACSQFINSAEPFAAALERACANRTRPILTWTDLDRDDATLRRFRSRTARNRTRRVRNIMTGVYALAMAMHLCPNGATVYGFSHEANHTAHDAIPYHCASTTAHMPNPLPSRAAVRPQ
jgi:hypothetical protein